MRSGVMALESLYRQVTEAILRAESLEDGTAEAAAVHLEVSQLEQQIAHEFPPSHPEGAIARRGAVRAALAAGDHRRAEHLAELYLAEPEAPPELVRTIQELASSVRMEQSAPGPDPTPTARTVVESHASGKSVFLSHSSTDRTAVRALYNRLRQDGLSVWLDEVDLLAGQNWEAAIRDAVRNSACVVVLLSDAATTRSGYIHKEIRYALDIADEQQEDAIFVIPARLEDCDVPARLKHLHRVDLFNRTGYDRLVVVLQAAIETASA